MKKLNIKQTLIIIGIVLIIGSIGLNLYFGLEKTKDIFYKKGFQDGATNIVNQIKSGIKVNFEEGTIMFVPNQTIPQQ